MLQVEDDSFPLEYSLEAVARVHDSRVANLPGATDWR